MPLRLFREEAERFQRPRLFGEVSLVQPLSGIIVAAVFGTLAFLIVIAFFTISFPRSVALNGKLEMSEGVVNVTSPRNGLVERSLVSDQSTVKQGSPIFYVSGEEFSESGGATATVAISRLRQRARSLADQRQSVEMVSRIRLEGLNQRLLVGGRELLEIQSQIDLQLRRVEFRQRSVDRFRSLQPFFSDAQIEQQQELLLDQQNTLGSLERAMVVAKRELEATKAAIASLPPETDIEIGRITRERAEIEQAISEMEARRTIIVRAERDGIISGVLAHVGDRITVGQPLASLVPDDARLEAVLLVPSSYIGFLHPGMPVTIKYNSFPFQKYGTARGRIESVSLAPAASTSYYRVKVSLERDTILIDGVSRRLLAGMELTASVAIDRRKLWEWAYGVIREIGAQ